MSLHALDSGSNSSLSLSLSLSDEKPKTALKNSVNTIPTVLLNRFFSFLAVKDSQAVPVVCKGWNRAKYTIGSGEIAGLIGDQTKQYSLKAVEDHCQKFSDVHELDCRTLVLDPKNPCSEHLIPKLLLARKTWQVVRLPETAQADENGRSDFLNRVLFVALIHLDSTPNITKLDLRTVNPTVTRSPFTVLQNQQIKTDKVTHLLCSDEYAKHNTTDAESTQQIFRCFPKLENLEIDMRIHGRISAVANLILNNPHLHTLRIVGKPEKPPLTFFTKGTYPSTFQLEEPRFRKVELVNCVVSESMVKILQKICTPSCELIYTNCALQLPNATMRLSARDLPSFPKPAGKAEGKRTA